MKRKLVINIQAFAVSEVSGGSYCNFNANKGTETFYMIICDNVKQSKIQCLVYLL